MSCLIKLGVFPLTGVLAPLLPWSRPRVKASAVPAPASDSRPAAAVGGVGCGGACGDGGVPCFDSLCRRPRPDSGTHRGRRPYKRKCGPRRHRRSWTGTGGGLLKISGLNIQSPKPKTAELLQEITLFNYDFVILSETWLRPSTPNRLLVFLDHSVKRADRSYKPLGHGGVAIVFRELYVCKPIKMCIQFACTFLSY